MYVWQSGGAGLYFADQDRVLKTFLVKLDIFSVRVQRSSVGSALAQCMAGPSSILNSAPQGGCFL